MSANEHFLVFSLSRSRFAIPLTVVQRVVRVVEITSIRNHRPEFEELSMLQAR